MSGCAGISNVPLSRGRLRGLVWTVLISGLAWTAIGFASAEESEPAEPAAPRTGDVARIGKILLVDRRLAAIWREGQELLQRGATIEGLRVIQSLLDRPEDRFDLAQVTEFGQPASFQGMAEALIGQLPDEARFTYEAQFGAVAQQQLDEARGRLASMRLAELSRRYLHTAAGRRATTILAARHAEAGRDAAAGIAYARLSSAVTGDAQGTVARRAAYCFLRAGLPDQARRMLSRAGLSATMHERALEVLRQGMPADTDSARVGHGTDWPDLPANWFLTAPGRPLWTVPTERTGAILESIVSRPEDWPGPLSRAVERESQAESPSEVRMPTVLPLCLGDRLFFRTLSGIVAIEATTGKVLWESLPDDSYLDLMLEADSTAAEISPEGSRTTIEGWVWQRLCNDGAWGRLTTDGTAIYAIEQPRTDVSELIAAGADENPHNRIVAWEISTGRVLWEAGGGPRITNQDLNSYRFLGPPEAYDGRLYVIAESGDELVLLALDPANGALVWRQPLGLLPRDSESNPFSESLTLMRRHQTGLQVSVESGLLICPIEGAVIALDATTRRLLWRYEYPPDEPNEEYGARWYSPQPVVIGGRLLLTPHDSAAVHLLDLVSGQEIWSSGRGDGLYPLGVFEGRLLLVGSRRVEALSLQTGKPAWDEAVAIDQPGGRGLLINGRCYLPQRNGTLVVLAAETGKQLHSWPVTNAAHLGHLAFIGARRTGTGTPAPPQFLINLPLAGATALPLAP